MTRPSRRLYEYCREHRSAAVSRRLEQGVTTLGDYSVIGSFSLLMGGIIAYERRQWTPLPLLAGGFVAEIGLQKALKRLVKGPSRRRNLGRPAGRFPVGRRGSHRDHVRLLAHLLAERWSSPAERRAIWSIVTALVLAQGGSRLYLGRHWPEDSSAGGWSGGSSYEP